MSVCLCACEVKLTMYAYGRGYGYVPVIALISEPDNPTCMKSGPSACVVFQRKGANGLDGGSVKRRSLSRNNWKATS